MVILLGAPGSGKGTQAKKIAAQSSVPHISTGDILREAVREKTELGRKAEPIMAAGALVPDDLMVGIIGERLGKADAKRGFVLDGFPRTTVQAEKLDGILKVHSSGNGSKPLRVIHLLVPDEVIVRRIVGRRSCPDCGSIYHLELRPPKVEGVCDRCGAALVARADDAEEAVRRRLEEFRKRTLPVAEYYRDKGFLKEVDGVGPVDEVFERIEQALAG